MIVVCCGVEAPLRATKRIGPEKEPYEGAAVKVCPTCGRVYEVWVRKIIVTEKADAKVAEETR